MMGKSEAAGRLMDSSRDLAHAAGAKLELEGLLARVEGAGGPSPEIEFRLWHALFPEREILLAAGDIRVGRPAAFGPLREMPVEGWPDWEGVARHVGADPVTASLDASLALVERLGLDAEQIVGEAVGDTWRWVDRVPDYRTRLVLSILATLLRALIAKGES